MLRTLLLLIVAAASGAALAAEPEADSFEDPPLPLAARVERSDEEALEVVSRAWYGQARLLLRRKEYAGALRGYQRAWRYNPEAERILPRVVLLAAQLGRPDVAGRYLAHVDDLSRLNPALLRQLGLQLSARGEWPLAIRLLEHSLPPADRQDEQAASPDVSTLLLHLELGRLRFLTGDHGGAAESFAIVRRALDRPELLKQNPALKRVLLEDPSRTYRLMGEAFLQAERWEAAEALFRRGLNQPEQAGLLALQWARIAAGQEKTAEAQRHLDKALASELDGAGTEPYQLMATLAAQEFDDPDEARRQLFSRLESRIQTEGTNAALRFFTAEAYLDAERWEDARRQLEAIQVLEPSGQVLERLVEVYRRTGDDERLLDTLELALVRTGSLDAVRNALRPILEQAEQVRALLTAAAAPAGDEADRGVATSRQLAAAWLALLSGEADEAGKLLKRALQAADPETPLLRDSRFWISWGLDCLASRRYAAAADALQRAVDHAPDDRQKAAALFYHSRALALDDRIEAALEAAREAARLQPDLPRIQAQPGWVLYVAKRHPAAIESYQQLLETFDGQYASAELREVMRDARLALSNLALQVDDRPQAEEWLEQVLDEFPDDIGALNDLGYLWAEDRKHLHRALTMVQAAVAGEPENAAYLDSLGWVYFQLGRYAEAVVPLEKAAAGERPDGVILDHLGDAYYRLDRIEDALAVWERAVAAFSDEEDAARRRATQKKLRRHRTAARAGD